MARILNWSEGEGRYKGIGALNCPGDPGCGASWNLYNTGMINTNPTMPGVDTTPFVYDLPTTPQDWTLQWQAELQSMASNVVPKPNQTVGDWVKSNASLLIIGGVVGLFLFKR